MEFERTLDGADILTVITVEEAVALREYIAHDYIPYDDKHAPLHALVQDVLRLLDKKGR